MKKDYSYMKQVKCSLILFAFLWCGVSNLWGQPFKTIGYLPYYRFSLIDNIQFDKITHLNIAFANPDMEGNLSVNEVDIIPIVERAHEAGVDVYISLAGGFLLSEYETAWKKLLKPENRETFIRKIIQFALNHNLQGIDVDLEWSHVDQNYSGFVLELKKGLLEYDLKLTAALPGTYRYPEISNQALQAFEWINMMIYDLRGPWAPLDPGPHSPYSFAIDAIQYWKSQGVSSDRLTLGIPFYGYDFANANDVKALTYSQIIAMNPGNAQSDQAGKIYYNGIPTVKAKTNLALSELSGVMIWELGQDHFSEWSLLNTIHEIIQMDVATEVTNIEATNIQLFPNPFHNYLQVVSSVLLDGSITLSMLDGTLMLTRKIENGEHFVLDTQNLPAGMYIVSFISSQFTGSFKLIKTGN